MTEHMENDKEERKWKVLRSEYLFRRPWLTVRRERIGLPGGGEIPEYYVLEYPDWVNTIARTCTGEFVFVRQYRRGLDRTCFELCAGVRDPQDATPEAAARREGQAAKAEYGRVIGHVAGVLPALWPAPAQ